LIGSSYNRRPIFWRGSEF